MQICLTILTGEIFFGGTIRTRETYGTRFMDAISIIEELLNSRIVTIRDRVQEGGKGALCD